MDKLPVSGYTVTDLIERFNLRVSEARRLHDFILSEVSGVTHCYGDSDDIVAQYLKDMPKEVAIRAALMYRNYAHKHQIEYEEIKHRDWPPEQFGPKKIYVADPSTTGKTIETVNIPLNLVFEPKGTDDE